METKTKKYQIKDKEYLFRSNMRAMIEFERAAMKPLSLMSTVEDQITLIWACTAAGMKKGGRDFDMKLEDFIDLIDGDYDLLSDLLEEVEEDPEKK